MQKSVVVFRLMQGYIREWEDPQDIAVTVLSDFVPRCSLDDEPSEAAEASFSHPITSF